MRDAPWYLKAYTLYDYWLNAKVRGEWSEETTAGRHWGYFVGDFTKLAWFYCVWLLVRKVMLVAFLELTDGSLNAGMSLVLQLVDTGMLLFLWPFNDSQTTFVEAVAGEGVGRESGSERGKNGGREREREREEEKEREVVCVCNIWSRERDVHSARGRDRTRNLKRQSLHPTNSKICPTPNPISRFSSGVTNTLTYFSIALPIMSQEWAFPLEWSLPPLIQFLVASFGAMLSAGSALCGSVMQLASAIMVCRGMVPSNPVLDFLANTGAGGLVAGFVADEALNQAVEGGGNEEEEEEKEAVRKALEDAPADTNVSMRLDMDFGNVEGKEEEFKAEVARDVASSLGADESKIRVLSLAPGSIWIHLEIEEGASPTHPSPSEARLELERQARDPASKLRASKNFKHLKVITSPEALKACSVGSEVALTPSRDETQKSIEAPRFQACHVRQVDTLPRGLEDPCFDDDDLYVTKAVFQDPTVVIASRSAQDPMLQSNGYSLYGCHGGRSLSQCSIQELAAVYAEVSRNSPGVSAHHGIFGGPVQDPSPSRESDLILSEGVPADPISQKASTEQEEDHTLSLLHPPPTPTSRELNALHMPTRTKTGFCRK